MRAGVLFLASLLAAAPGFAAGPGCGPLMPYIQAGSLRPSAGTEAAGAEAFAVWRRTVAATARESGARDIAAQISSLEPGRPVSPGSAEVASCLLRYYLVTQYGERMVEDLRALVGFRTYAEEGRENWDAPEFLRQREWLRRKADELGLAFKSYDGRVDEVTLPGPKPILAVLTHGDVQGVEGQTWSSPPWEAKVLDGGRIVGRGTEDDKGPIVAALYSIAALRDTGWTLDSTLRLLIANGEESSWEEIPYYLERAPMPEMTVGVDAAYPVTHAQKGYGVLTFRAGKPAGDPRPGEWRVAKASGGSGMSIVPDHAEAVLEPAGGGGSPAEALARLGDLATRWAAAHPPASLAVSREGGRFKVEAAGQGGHSAWPETAHNALGDLTAFLATLPLQMDPWSALVLFTGVHLGTGTDGRALGIAHSDPVMGPLTASFSFLREDGGVPIAEINIRPPQGISLETVQRQIAERARTFTQQTGVPLTAEARFDTQPHLAPTEGELVSTLLSVWEEVTGRPGKPVAIGGGTQARFFQGGVDFGPALSMEKYRGHGPDEFLTVDELHRTAELTAAALLRLAAVQGAAVSR